MIYLVIVYSKPGCMPCKFTKDYLTKNGIDYSELSIYDYLDYVQELGYSQAPVVVTDNDHWSGFNDTKLKKLA